MKEPAHGIARAGKSEICMAGQQTGNLDATSCYSLGSEGCKPRLRVLQSGGRIPSTLEISVFALQAISRLAEAHPLYGG